MKYLKKFNTHTEYEEARQNLILPNVSLCAQENEVHYNPYVPPMNVITYRATEKLTESTASWPTSGFKTNAFSGSSGQRLTMESHTFENGVGTVEFDGDIASIGNYAFYGCKGLTSITILDSITSIGSEVFYGCSSLTSIDIPNGVTSIGQSAFFNTPWWSTYSADTSHHYGNIIYINDVAYKATATTISSCTFREGTVSIGDSAFTGCTSLTSVTIGNTVTSIGRSAFFECKGLTSVTIGNSVTSIGYSAFGYCTSLTSITIPNSVTSIGNSAFQGCSGLTSVTIPNSVTSLGQSVFQGCSGLTSVTVNATTPPTLGSNAFNNTNDCPIYVPSTSVDAYKSASGWSGYASRIQAIQ